MKPDGPPPFDYDLGRWCHRHGLSGTDVARILGCSPGHVSRCKSGKRQLSLDAWAVLQRFAGDDEGERANGN